MMKKLQRFLLLALTVALSIEILPVNVNAKQTKKDTKGFNRETIHPLKAPYPSIVQVQNRTHRKEKRTLDKNGNVIYPVGNGNIYFNKNKNTIVKADQTITSVTIPEKIDGIPVKVIGNQAFQDCKKLKEVILPKGLEEIGYRAFSQCTSLEKIFIPKTVVRSGNFSGYFGRWFQGCDKLKEIVLEEGTSRIVEGSFNGILSSYKMVIPESVKEIGQQAFLYSTGIKKVTYGEPVKEGTIVIPKTVKSIGKEVFTGCSELETVKWPEQIKTIPNQAFQDCKKLKEVILPKG
ncbi:leucine-rich repeat domain-containing protein, partial [Bulleidia extructa]